MREITRADYEELSDEEFKRIIERYYFEYPEEPEEGFRKIDIQNPVPRKLGRIVTKPVKNSVGFMYGPMAIKRR